MTSYYEDPAAGQQDSVPRRLPPVPVAPRSARPTSRPLPQVPRALACKQCGTCITSTYVLLPTSAYPQDSRLFRGFSGKASLFTETYNVKLSRPGVQLMATGAHTMQEITCSSCSLYLGWKILRAHEHSEKWKEGNCLLELENLYHDTDGFPSPLVHPRGSMSSDSDSDYSS
ncbi:hypothetical protein Hypma_007908 [Hypsizygus marmoreus]|uniref:Yippee domain-containing protein n=1 Tax=Hypsizygus marmoreus TaxID=39966 RepID=A0A369JX13_HYPMA|nr:hypothetical protein Hypma_007908 [Hypsizygus marmoreus]